MTKLEKIDEAANNYNKTKDLYYKDLWYKLIKEFANGPHTIERRTLSTSGSDKRDDGWYRVIE
jgi:hypothetical protein